MNKMKYAGIVALAAVAALGMSACSTGGAATTSDGGSDRASTVVIADPNAPTFTQNFSPLSPTQGEVDLFWFYEPLVRTTVGGGVEPWLAKDLSWDPTTNIWSMTLRSNVKFADGSTMTPADVLYSLNLYLAHPEYGFGMPCDYDSVSADGNVIKLHYPGGWTYDNAVSLGLKLIVPKAKWQDRDPTTDLDPHPDGSGPFTLENFSQQQVTVKARDDYWGGTMPMKTVKLVASSAQAAQAQIISGQADWAVIDWAGGKEALASHKDTIWWQRDEGDGMALFFNHTKAPFNDVAFRKAISMSLDRTKLAKLTGSDAAGPANETGLAEAVYKDWIKPEYQKPEAADPKAALKTLTDAGYTIAGGKLSKGGTSYPLDILIDNSTPTMLSLAKGIVDQVQKTLGITITIQQQNSDTYQDDAESGQFNLLIGYEGNSQGASMVYERVIDPAQLKPIGTNTTMDQSRWNDPTTAALLKEATTTTDTNVAKNDVNQLEDIVVQQVPFAPLITTAMAMQISTKYWTGWPSQTDASYYPYPYGNGLCIDGILTLMNLKPKA